MPTSPHVNTNNREENMRRPSRSLVMLSITISHTGARKRLTPVVQCCGPPRFVSSFIPRIPSAFQSFIISSGKWDEGKQFTTTQRQFRVDNRRRGGYYISQPNPTSPFHSSHGRKFSTGSALGSSEEVGSGVLSSTGDMATAAASARSSTIDNEERIVQNMLYRIRKVNDVPDDVRSNLLDFVVEGKRVGKVTKAMASTLCDAIPEKNPIFQLAHNDPQSTEEHLTLTKAAGSTCQSRTDAVMTVMSHLRTNGLIKGWRDELYPVAESFYDEPLLLVERAAAPFVGAQEYGVHINGLITDEDDGETKMWMARRSQTKSKYPGMLDHIVAGGQPAGLSLMANVIKECMEEAGIPQELTQCGIKSGGAISYETYVKSSDVISRCVLFCYDLHLPSDFIPRVVDGEVDEFLVWTMDEVMESMDAKFHDPIKPNCYPVIIDYLIRAGYVSPETRGYLDVLRELRSGYCG